MLDKKYDHLLVEKDKYENWKNKGYFEKNLKAYKENLTQLDEKYASTLSEAEKDIIFGGKFALGYLFHRYDISYMSAYDSCSANSEPSIADTAFLANFVATNDIKAVYCQEYTDPKVAREIASYNNAEVLVIHSCHNLNKEDREGFPKKVIPEQRLEMAEKLILKGICRDFSGEMKSKCSGWSL